MDRLQMLKDILAQDHKNTLARYGLGMEYSTQGDVDSAVGEFKTLISENPDYTNAYFMAAQTLARAGRSDEARKLLEDGLSSANRTGNRHAASEMQAFLDELG